MQKDAISVLVLRSRRHLRNGGRSRKRPATSGTAIPASKTEIHYIITLARDDTAFESYVVAER